MEIRIAGLCWRLTFRDEVASRLCRARYGAFAVPSDVPAVATIDATIGADARDYRGVAGTSDVGVTREGESFALRRLDFEATLDRAGGRADVTFGGGIGAMQTFLRVASALALVPKGAVLVHASSVVRGDRAFVFIGESGAGKTTICRLSVPSVILSDEVSAIVPRDDGGYACFATPFWGDLGDDREDTGHDESGRPVPLREAPATAPLAGVLFPVKDGRDAIVATSRASAFAVLTREALSFGDDERTMETITESCARIVARVPVAELHFRKTRAFWSHVDEWSATNA